MSDIVQAQLSALLARIQALEEQIAAMRAQSPLLHGANLYRVMTTGK